MPRSAAKANSDPAESQSSPRKIMLRIPRPQSVSSETASGAGRRAGEESSSVAGRDQTPGTAHSYNVTLHLSPRSAQEGEEAVTAGVSLAAQRQEAAKLLEVSQGTLLSQEVNQVVGEAVEQVDPVNVECDRGDKYQVSIRLPRMQRLFRGETPPHGAFELSSDSAAVAGYRDALQRQARYLVTGINAMLADTDLADELKAALRDLHLKLLEEVPGMKFETLCAFTEKLGLYLEKLRKVIEEHVSGQEVVPTQVDTVPTQPDVPPATAENITTEEAVLVSPRKKRRVSLVDKEETVPKLESPKKEKLESPRKEKVEKPKKRGRRRTKPKMPYSRYHFALPPELDVPTLANVEEEDDDLVEQAMTISLLDVISGSRLVTPLRTRFCSHVECFDMSSFLAMNRLRPFKVGVRRMPPLPDKAPNVQAILCDTRRSPMRPGDHNEKTLEWEYKNAWRYNREKNKYNNSLEYFCCPICNLEFSIKNPGDVYVVGDLVDLLFDLELSENMDAEKIEVEHDGTWFPVVPKEEKKEEAEAEEIIDLSEEEEAEVEETVTTEETVTAPPPLPVIPSPSEPVLIESQSQSDDWDEEFSELEKLMDSGATTQNTVESTQVRPGISEMLSQSRRERFIREFAPNQQYNRYATAKEWQFGGTHVQPQPQAQAHDPVFFTGNGDQDDPFVID